MLREKCLVCESADLTRIIDLGMHSFADTFIPTSKFWESEPVYPLACNLCKACGQIQTACITDPMDRYVRSDYSYTSSNSSFSREHWTTYAAEVPEKAGLRGYGFIVEAGSNDGFLAERLMEQGHRVVGVDPSERMAELADARGVKTIISLFDEQVAGTIEAEYGKPEMIIVNNTFNHANDPLRFARAVHSLLADNGTFVFELPYWVCGLRQNRFDQIYHEHVSYFTVKSASSLMKEAGMTVTHVEEVDYHGGSLRVFAKKAKNGLNASPKALDMIRDEETCGVFNEKTYQSFMNYVQEQRCLFLETLYGLKKNHMTIVGVGAAAKGNTLLTFYGLDRTMLDFVTDSSPHKQGKFTPLTRIPILGDDALKDKNNIKAIILSWNIADLLKKILLRINPDIQFIDLPQPTRKDLSL